MTMTSRSHRRGRVRLALPALLVAVALMTAACGGDDNKTSAPSTSSGADPLGAAKPAAAAPVKIGFITQGVTASNDTVNERKGAEIAAKYANDYLGGLGGHKIEVVVCEEKGTPAGGADCGQQMTTNGVQAVVTGAPGQLDAWLKTVNGAGIPIAANQASTTLSLTTPGVFVFNNALSAFGTPAAFAREKGIKSAALLTIDIPTASGPAKALSPTFFKNAGATVDVIAIPPGTPDMSAQVAAAQAKKPGMWSLVGNFTFCTSAITAMRNLGITAPIVAIEQCIGADKGATIPGGGYNGVTIAVLAVSDPADKEFQLYGAAVAKYKDSAFVQERGTGGWQAMLSFIRAVNASGSTDITKAGITAGMKSAPAVPYPLGGGATFQCNGKALPDLAPNVCSSTAIVATADKSATLSGYKTINGDGIYTKPTS
ncbi:MAG: Branched-chain amino acid transport system substrate-binding protein [Frankiales bacterium]|nr:Branched-chain amino acid transport system substrate-binding protein [Frankiales bacterium]